MQTTSTRPQSFEEALRLINQAMVTESASFKELLNADYSNLRAAIEDMAPRVANELKTTTTNFANDVDKYVRANPYPVLGGIALTAIALGFLFGRKTAPTAVYTGVSYGDAPEPGDIELA